MVQLHTYLIYKLQYKMINQYLSIFAILSLAAKVSSDCQDLTLDDCRGKTNQPPFSSVKLESEKTCQKYCSDIYPNLCTFFIYDRQQNGCNLYSYDPEDYVESCNQTGGTPLPSLAECKNSNDECLVRTGLEFSLM